jgi:hypothetical protein
LLVVGGGFTAAGSVPALSIAAFDGTSWSALGPGLNGSVSSLVVWDRDGAGPEAPVLVAGGFFTRSGSTLVNRIAVWNGTAWSGVGPAGLDAFVSDLCTWDPDGTGPLVPNLVAAGSFFAAGSVPARGLAIWNGSAWSSVGSASLSAANAIASWDPDGVGPATPLLIVGGNFGSVAGVTAKGIAAWNGAAWLALGDGVGPLPGSSIGALDTLYASAVGPDGAMRSVLIASGLFGSAGGVPAEYVARWSCPATVEPPRFDLAVDAISFDKLEYEPGEIVRITARLRNLGPMAATGTRSLAVYLTRQTGLDATARLLEARSNSDSIASGAETTVAFVVPAPTSGSGPFRAAVGVYPVVVETDPEYGNNVAVSSGVFDVGVIEMALGQTRSFSIPPGTAVRVRVTDAASVRTVRASVQGSPTLNTIDTRLYRSGAAVVADLARATSAAGTLSVLFSNDGGPAYIEVAPRSTAVGPTSVEIALAEAPFAIDSFTPTVAHADVPAVLLISGASFPADSRVFLMDGETVIEEATVTRFSAVQLSATLTMRGVSPGEYRVRVVSPSENASIESGSTIVVRPRDELPLSGLRVDLNAPAFVALNRPFPVTLSHVNGASVPLVPPVLVLRGPNGFERRIVVRGRLGDVDKLFPNEAGSFLNEWREKQPGPRKFTLSRVAAEGPFDWAGFASRNRPPEIAVEDWTTAVEAARSSFGDTWESILSQTRKALDVEGSDSYGKDDVSRVLAAVVGTMLYRPNPLLGRPSADSPFEPEPTKAVVRKQPTNPSTATWIVVMHGWAGPGSAFESPGAGAKTVAGATDALAANAAALGGNVGVIEVSYDSRTIGFQAGDARLSAEQAGRDLVPLLQTLGVNDPSRVTAYGHSNGVHGVEAMGEEFERRTGKKIGRIYAGNVPSIAGTCTEASCGGLKGTGASDYVVAISGSVADAYRGFTDERRAELERNGIRVRQVWLESTDPGTLEIEMHSRSHELIEQWLGPGATAEQREFAVGLLTGLPIGTDSTGEFDIEIDPNGTPEGVLACSDINVEACRGEQWIPDLGEIPEWEIDSCTTEIVASVDPNDILGPAGFGPEGWIASDTDLLYTIRFENLASASAPAQEIRITQPLDADLEDASIDFLAFGLGDRVFPISKPSGVVQRRLYLQSESDVLVDTELAFDPSTRTIRAEFLAIDPLTLVLPFDPFKGILPPNTEPPKGEGFVLYRVRPKKPVVQGTEVAAQASIVFDLNEAIQTPRISNRFDTSAPATRLGAIDPASGPDVDVPFELTDPSAGAPATEFVLYRSVNDGPMEQVGRYPITQTGARVPIQPLSRNRFVVYGVDAVGNVEAPKTAAESISTIGADLTGDGLLDSEDFFAFFNRWLAVDPATDVNGDGIVDEADVQVFLAALRESM